MNLAMVNKKSESFGDRVLDTLNEKGMSQAQLARSLGVTRQHLNAVLKGRTPAGAGLKKKIASILGQSAVSLEYGKNEVLKLFEEAAKDSKQQQGSLFFREDSAPYPAEEEFIAIPYLDAVPSMGGGSYETNRSIKSYLSFQQSWIRTKGHPSSMAVVRASGDSMRPTIPDGSVVLIDEAQKDIVHGKIYFIAHNDAIFIKRLLKLGEDANVIYIASEGAALGPISHHIMREGSVDFYHSKDNHIGFIRVEEGDYFEVIGRCLWVGKELTD